MNFLAVAKKLQAIFNRAGYETNLSNPIVAEDGRMVYELFVRKGLDGIGYIDVYKGARGGADVEVHPMILRRRTTPHAQRQVEELKSVLAQAGIDVRGL